MQREIVQLKKAHSKQDLGVLYSIEENLSKIKHAAVSTAQYSSSEQFMCKSLTESTDIYFWRITSKCIPKLQLSSEVNLYSTISLFIISVLPPKRSELCKEISLSTNALYSTESESN